MFKKLKEKITEEVKISPQRFQQLTQSVSDKLQGTSAPEGNMFSIGEDDGHTSHMNSDQGFSSVTLVSPSSDSRTRRTSNSSIASDVSFLPRYEAGSLYHLQSDLDASASEVEDNVSQSSSQLGHVSKEQVYSAFQKSQMRYHKYRGRYTDLARHYKELERENAKMKSVLVESQDKAIRRVTELKEQCALEQKAKAHLESALRDELDERQMKIQSLQTKIGLLQQGPNSADGLIDLDKKEVTNTIDSDKLEQLTKYLTDARAEIEALNNKIQEYKASAIVFQSKEQEYKAKVATLEKDISNFSNREKENNIKLAENKMELHNELLSKDSEISRLKQEVESLRSTINAQEKENRSTKIENLQSQNTKLIEKLENQTQKCNGLENELLKVEKYKIEIRELTNKNLELSKELEEEKAAKDRVQELLDENSQLQNVIGGLKIGLSTCQENLKRLTEEKQQLITTVQKEKHDYENQIHDLRESAKKGLFTLEKQISDRVGQTYKEKQAILKQEFEEKLKEISSNNQTAADMHLQLIKQEGLVKDLSNELETVKEKLTQKDAQYRELENNHLDLIEESSRLRSSVNNLEKQLSEIGNENSKVYEEKIARLQANIKTLHEAQSELEKICEHKEQIIVQLSKDSLNLESANTEAVQKYRLMEEKQEGVEMETTENNLLEMKVQALEYEKKSLQGSFELERKLFNKITEEHNELKIKEITITELEDRNRKLEEKIVRLKGFLKAKENTIVEVNKIKLGLEQELIKAKESFRIMEEHEEVVELDKTECNLLQIKVQQLENEKESLLKSFECERHIFDHSFHKKNEELENHKEDIIKENVSLAKENLELKQINDELYGKVRIYEERDQVVELESSECSLLKLKLQELEIEKEELLKEFEMERELFNKILVEHRELKEKEERIKDLEGSIEHLTQKIAKLKEYLKIKETTIVKLQKDNLANEQVVAKLKQSLRIKEEQIDCLAIEKTECSLLEMKLTALEEENRNLLNSFEVERITFEEAFSKGAHIENKIDELNQQIIQLNQDRDNLEDSFRIEKQELVDSFEVERKNFQLTDTELRKVNQENVLLKEEKEKLNCKLKEETEILAGQIDMLNEEVNRLQTVNDDLRKELDIREEKLDELTSIITQLNKEVENSKEKYNTITETLSKERTEKKEAIAKLREMQQELDKNNSEIVEIKKSLETVDQLYNDAKNQQSADVKRLDVTRRKLNEMENEKIKLDKELKKKTDEFQFKAKEMSVIEQQFNVLNQDKENVLQENKQMRERIEELTQECEQLRALVPKVKDLEQVKKQNEASQKECDKLNQEISELKVRINQLSSDNRNINEEHDSLVTDREGYKAKCEFLEVEKGEFETVRSELERERDSLLAAVTDLTEKLQQKLEQTERQSPASNNLDLAQIQQDFLELKEKCQKLDVENSSLRAEYAKVEEQCTSFRKVKKDLESQITELERHYNEALHEKQLLRDEIQELKFSPINAVNNSKLDNLSIVKQEKYLASAPLNGPNPDNDWLQIEVESLREKVTKYKSLDITNKSSIEFYENELQKIKNKNEKLNRKLDETLVTLNHCAELSSSTEIEYLRNVLYNYMLGKESMVLARVIAAVCKFDPIQTEAVLQKEQQKQTLLGQLGIL